GRAGETGVSAAQFAGNFRMAPGETFDVNLVNDRFVPGDAQVAVRAPVEGVINHYTLGHQAGAVALVEAEVGLRVTNLVAEQRIIPLQGPVDGFRIGIE